MYGLGGVSDGSPFAESFQDNQDFDFHFLDVYFNDGLVGMAMWIIFIYHWALINAVFFRSILD